MPRCTVFGIVRARAPQQRSAVCWCRVVVEQPYHSPHHLFASCHLLGADQCFLQVPNGMQPVSTVVDLGRRDDKVSQDLQRTRTVLLRVFKVDVENDGGQRDYGLDAALRRAGRE